MATARHDGAGVPEGVGVNGSAPAALRRGFALRNHWTERPRWYCLVLFSPAALGTVSAPLLLRILRVEPPDIRCRQRPPTFPEESTESVRACRSDLAPGDRDLVPKGTAG